MVSVVSISPQYSTIIFDASKMLLQTRLIYLLDGWVANTIHMMGL
jgi:hypothetical protein